MRSSLLISAPLLLGAALSAQGVIVPSNHATNRPDYSPFYVSYVFYSTSSTTVPHDSRSQLIYSNSDISLPGGVWNSMDVRRPGSNSSNTYLGNNNPAMTANVVLTLSVSATPVGSMTNTFATNHGPNPMTVLNGPVSLPARNGAATWPMPWENIPFSSPMVFVNIPGGSLVVDITQTNNTATTAWYLEAQSPFNGAREGNGAAPSTCRFSSGTYNNSIGYTMPRLGGTWYVNYSGLLNNAIGFAWLGGQGVGGTYGGLTLPIDLSPLGAPGCNIFASADYVVGLAATGTSARWPTIPIPNDPGLARASFYDHSLWFDSAANNFGVVVGWSSKWTIGDGVGAPAAALYATGNSAANPTGTLSQGTGVTLQFNP